MPRRSTPTSVQSGATAFETEIASTPVVSVVQTDTPTGGSTPPRHRPGRTTHPQPTVANGGHGPVMDNGSVAPPASLLFMIRSE